MLANLAVVGDLDEVVDLRPAADDGRTHGRPVDRGPCSDLDIVLDDDGADMGDSAVPIIATVVAETVAPDDGGAVHDHAAAEDEHRDTRWRWGG